MKSRTSSVLPEKKKIAENEKNLASTAIHRVMRGTDRTKLHSRMLQRAKLIQKAQDAIAARDGGKRKHIREVLAATTTITGHAAIIVPDSQPIKR